MTKDLNAKTAKKHKEFFDLGLYVEALKRIRLPGIILSVLLTLEAILIPLGLEIGYVMTRRMYGADHYVDYTPEVLGGSELHIFLFLVAVIGAPVFTWVLFSFLNKRNASDYYHSLPHTRLSLYVSNVAALVSWLAGIIIVTSGISRLTASLFPKVISVEVGTYFPYMAGCFALSLLISACIIIGKSITGTVFSNLVVTALIMVFPRFVMSMVTGAVTAKLPIIPEDYVNFFLSPKLNILTGMLGQLSDIFYVETPCIYDGVSQIYTTVLALVYLVFGAFLFCRRKSESAQRSAPSKRMQAIYRIILAFTVSVPFCYVIFGYDNDPVSLVFLCGMLALLSGLTYFIYEILTTRKWKNLIRAIPGFFIVLLLDVLLFGTMYGITALESTFRPKPEDIEYVQLVGERYGQENYGLDFKSYVEQETAKMKITDDEGIKTVADCLNETFEFYEKYGGIDEWYSDSYHGSYVEKEEYAEIYTFKIKTDGGLTKYRNVRLYSEDVNVIRESLKKLDGYTEMWTSLPTPQRGTLTMDSGAFEITNEQAEKIFEVFRRELVSVDFDKWVEFNMGYEAAFAWFHYRTASVYLTVPVSAELFPKTVDQLLLYAKVNSDENFKAIKEAYEKYENAYVQWAELLVYENGTFNYYGTVSDFHTEDRLELVLDSRDDSVFKIGDSFLRVDIEFYNEESDKKLEKDDMKYLSCIIKVNDEAKEKLAPLFDGAFKG